MIEAIPATMKAWRLDRLGGELRLDVVPVPDPAPGGILVKIEATTLMSYLKAYVEGRLPAYHAPAGPFTPGGNGVGTIAKIGDRVWQLGPGQQVILSPLVRSAENVPDPAQILLGVTSFGPDSKKLQADWPDGTLAEYVVVPAAAVVPIDGFTDMEPAQLAGASRFVVPYGGLVRGRLAAGETLIVNGATGAYGSAAVLVAMAMGAGRVVAVGRNREKLARIGRIGGGAVVTMALTGDVAADAEALRAAADGGATMALDMIGGAQDARSTMACLNALRREGRLVLMGSVAVDLLVPYLQLMIRGVEIIGNFMHKPDAYRNVLGMMRVGRLDITVLEPKVFSLIELPAAMEAAAAASGFETVVVRP